MKNLKAKLPAAAGGSKEERKRERLSETTRSILDAAAAAHTIEKGSHRSARATSRMVRYQIAIRKKS